MKHLRCQTIREHQHETACDWCGAPLYVGDRVYYSTDGGAFCCRSCAAKATLDSRQEMPAHLLEG